MIHLDFEKSIKTLKIESEAFVDNSTMPSKYTCEGKNVNPDLWIKNLPDETLTLALVMEDPDAPIKPWIHWIAWDIPVTHHISENSKRGTSGLNDFQKKYYCGPCPPKGTHHYVFKVYALDVNLYLNEHSRVDDLNKAIVGHVLAYGELTCTYGNPIKHLNEEVSKAFTSLINFKN